MLVFPVRLDDAIASRRMGLFLENLHAKVADRAQVERACRPLSGLPRERRSRWIRSRRTERGRTPRAGPRALPELGCSWCDAGARRGRLGDCVSRGQARHPDRVPSGVSEFLEPDVRVDGVALEVVTDGKGRGHAFGSLSRLRAIRSSVASIRLPSRERRRHAGRAGPCFGIGVARSGGAERRFERGALGSASGGRPTNDVAPAERVRPTTRRPRRHREGSHPDSDGKPRSVRRARVLRLVRPPLIASCGSRRTLRAGALFDRSRRRPLPTASTISVRRPDVALPSRSERLRSRFFAVLGSSVFLELVRIEPSSGRTSTLLRTLKLCGACVWSPGGEAFAIVTKRGPSASSTRPGGQALRDGDPRGLRPRGVGRTAVLCRCARQTGVHKGRHSSSGLGTRRRGEWPIAGNRRPTASGAGESTRTHCWFGTDGAPRRLDLSDASSGPVRRPDGGHRRVVGRRDVPVGSATTPSITIAGDSPLFDHEEYELHSSEPGGESRSSTPTPVPGPNRRRSG